MAGGYVGKILRVDLSKGTFADEALPAEAVLRKYVGGLGLGLAILMNQPPGVKPFDPESRLVFMTGPLTGTPVMSGNNTTIVCLSAETGYTVGASHSHGYFGPYLKFAGYDGLIIQGKLSAPAYLWVRPGKAELREAGHLWGKDSHETEDAVRGEIGDSGDTAVATIGPAGENMLLGAAICNERYHLFSKAGVGAILGSKKLKAIAIDSRGGSGIPVRDVPGLLAVARDWRASALGPDVWYSLAPQGIAGINTAYWRFRPGMQPKPNFVRAGKYVMAVKNLSDPDYGSVWRARSREGATKFKITPVACYNCNRACVYSAEITEGPYKGHTATLTGGGENFEASAGMIGVDEPGAVFYLADYMDRMGFDSGTVGCAISLAYECYERGILTKKDTDGLELKWGNFAAAKELIDKVIRREGIGAILSEGAKKAAETIGGEAPRYAVHVKGTGMNMHDWRGAWGTLLGQCISGAGPCWQAPGIDAYSPEPDLGYPELSKDPISAEGKAEEVFKTQCKKLFEDSIGVCWFAVWGVRGSLDFERRAIAATTGWDDFSIDEGLTLGKRLITLQRIFNMKRGLTLANDLDVGQRLLEAPASGPGKGKAFGDHLPGLVRQYYALAGWDPETGKPLPGTVRDLGLQKEAKGL